jgi:hypothetical protein
MKLIIAGSRSIKDYNVTRQAIIESGLWHTYGKKIVVVSGEAEGPDKHGLIFSEKAGLKKPIKKPAKWDDIKAPGAVVRYRRDGKPYNVLAGYWRNEEMAQIADAALIVWDGRSTGSLDMLHRMVAHGKSDSTYLFPLRIDADALDRLQDKCHIIFPNSLTQDK